MNERTFDVVVWGATGFTGRLVSEYFTQRYGVGRDLKWAIAGRSRAKLEEIRTALCSIDPATAKLAILTGDAGDRASLAAIAKETRVIASTVGPYSKYGRELVAACVDAGTDSVDLTGEPQFIRAMIDEHHARAKETGARIVNCCGYDSIPSDLGTLALVKHLRDHDGQRCVEVKCFAGESKGGMSGGTAASMMNLMSEAANDKRVRRVLGDPYALDPDRGERGPDGQDQRGVRFDDELGMWTAPFVMAAINSRVVRRTNALLGYAYGKDFRYSEAMSCGRGAKGLAFATGITTALGIGMTAAAIGPVRAVLAKKLPQPGDGPKKELRDAGFFVTRLIGRGERGARAMATVRGEGDPGYAATSRMIGESAVCLAKDGLERRGGVTTPGAAMGETLIGRLAKAGVTIDVKDL